MHYPLFPTLRLKEINKGAGGLKVRTRDTFLLKVDSGWATDVKCAIEYFWEKSSRRLMKKYTTLLSKYAIYSLSKTAPFEILFL